MDTTSWVARWLVPAVHGADEALEALADRAAESDWVAGWALQVAVELRAGFVGDESELPLLSPDARRRLEQTVRGLVEGGG